MPKFSISGLRGKFSKESRQARLEARLQKQLGKEHKKYERYATVSAEQERINKLKKEIASYKSMRGAKKRQVKIGGHTFNI